MKSHFKHIIRAGVVCVLSLQVQADGGDGPDVTAAMQASFEAKKQATMDRLTQDETQVLCTQHAPGPLPLNVNG